MAALNYHSCTPSSCRGWRELDRLWFSNGEVDPAFETCHGWWMDRHSPCARKSVNESAVNSKRATGCQQGLWRMTSCLPLKHADIWCQDMPQPRLSPPRSPPSWNWVRIKTSLGTLREVRSPRRQTVTANQSLTLFLMHAASDHQRSALLQLLRVLPGEEKTTYSYQGWTRKMFLLVHDFNL